MHHTPRLKTGVYVILNTANGKYYIGSSADRFGRRWSLHRKQLEKGAHGNRHLQGAWNKYGANRFAFFVLERCDPGECVSREQRWIDEGQAANPRFGYNLSPTAGSALGTRWTDKQRAAVTKPPKSCRIAGCTGKVRGHGLCNMHYYRWLRHGDPSVRIRFVGDPVACFWQKVNKNGPLCPRLGTRCWSWAGTIKPNGYAARNVKNRTPLAHRFSWELHRGPVPEGLQVLHHCGNRACVNPAHLYLGTRRDKAAQMVAEGKYQKGEERRHHKLTAQKVREIRRDYRRSSRTNGCEALARKHGVSPRLVFNVVNGLAWKHV